MLILYLLFSGVCALLAAIEPKLGLWLMLVVGLVADPVRKLTPANPVYIQVVFVIIFVVTYLGHRKTHYKDQRLLALFPEMRPALQLFFLFFAISAIRPLLINIAYLKLILYSSAQYIGLFIAAMLGFGLVKDEKTIIKYADVFIVTLLPFLVSVLFHFWGFDEAYPILKVMSIGEWFQYHTGEPLSTLCGLFRFPEGMGWYAMMVSMSACFLLARKKRNPPRMVYYISVFMLATFCTLLSGRRKFFLGVFVFIFIFIILSMRKNPKKGITYLVLFMIASAAFFHYAGRAREAALYFESGQPGAEVVEERVRGGAIGSMWWAISRDGFFGRGLGATVQVAGHLGPAAAGVGGIEAGGGKIISELGVPGFIALVMVFLAYLRGVYRKVIKGRFKDTGEVTGVFLLALVLTHVIQYAISHQIYGDPLIAVLTGLMFGFLLALPRIKKQEKTINQETPSNA